MSANGSSSAAARRRRTNGRVTSSTATRRGQARAGVRAPRQARAQQTVGVILEAAKRVLIQEGYDGATTNRVAEVAGVSIGSLYQYFPNKEALIASLAQAHLDEILRLVSEGLADAAALPLTEAVRRLVSAMLRVHHVEPELHRVLHEQVPRLLGYELCDINARSQVLIEQSLRARRAELRPDLDPRLAAHLVMWSVEAVTHGSVIETPQLARHEALVDEIVHLVVRYLTP
jgi:AcrR family transcriptional regulator